MTLCSMLPRSVSSQLGPLQPPDENGIRLPVGFRSRIVARSGSKPVATADYVWHSAPDGGATFETDDGGWIYVSNSEMEGGQGGTGALRFDSDGIVVDAYQILSGTRHNCAGGPTPWKTWLSCEEVQLGSVWECDPFGKRDAVELPALGYFMHEAATVDNVKNQIYLTEDERDGRFYRFTPDNISGDRLDLTTGLLEIATVVGRKEGQVFWRPVPNPNPTAEQRPTRRQVRRSTRFRGGEGVWYHDGTVYFSTKGDNRLWAYDTDESILTLIYNDDFFENAELTGVDNITVSSRGDVFVAEDGGDMQIVAITPFGKVMPILQIVGHLESEVTGPAFDPSGTRLYFSSQRGRTGLSADGVTFEVTGPFMEEDE